MSRPAPSGPGGRRSERGSAVVDFTLVGALITLVFVAVVQLAVTLHVRNTLIDCAGDGARYGALADRTPADGAIRARELIGQDLSPAYARDVTASRELHAGLDTVVVRIRAPLPVAGLLGVGRAIEVTGHAVAATP
jgi:hypothetical protein